MKPTHESELVIRWAPLPGTEQESFFDDDTKDAHLLLLGGYASGKTMTLCGKALKLSALNAPLPILWVVPDYAHIHDTILPTLESVDPDTSDPWFLSPSQYHYHETRHILTWIGGGPIWFMTAENPDSIAGPNVAAAVVDEPAGIPFRAWRNTCARVRHPGAKLRQKVAAGTDDRASGKATSWLSELFGPDRSADYRLYRIATSENTELLRAHPDYIEQVRANATPAEVAAYLEGKFANLAGARAYPEFDAALHWRSDVQRVDTLPLSISFDFNVDPMAAIVGQIIPGPVGPVACVVDAITLYGSTVMQVCAEIMQRYPRWNPGLRIYGDAAGKARSHQSLRSNYDIIRELLAPVGPISISVPAANPPVARRLNSVNRMLRDGRGQVRLFIARTDPPKLCKTRDLVRSLEQTVKKPGTDDVWKKPGETVTHHGDALGYWIDAEFPAEKPMVAIAAVTSHPRQRESNAMAAIRAQRTAQLRRELEAAGVRV